MRIRRIMTHAVGIGLSIAMLGAATASAETSIVPNGNFATTPDGPVVAVAVCGEGKLCGRIVALGRLPNADSRNPDAAQKSRALCGLQVLTLNGSKGTAGDYIAWDGSYYHAGHGTTYKVRLLTRNADTVNVYGNSTTLPLTRTYQLSQLWSRVQPSTASCAAPAS